jgi:hypothetical protein
MKRDVFGKIMENVVNTSPISGGVHRTARYSPHQGRMEITTEQVDRLEILAANKVMYEANKGKFNQRKDLAGGVPLRIPKMDYYQLYEDNPWLNHCDKETKAKFFKKLYREHVEYRIG